MSYNIVVDTTKDTDTIKTSKKVIMATKAANRIKDKWAEQGFEISESCPCALLIRNLIIGVCC